MIILGTNSVKAAGGFEVANSCRFNDGDSPSMSKSIASTSASWTFSAWVKRGSNLGTTNYLVSWGDSGTDGTGIGFDSGNNFFYYSEDSPDNILVETTAVYRDVSAWYHLVCKCSSGSITLYVNGASAATGSGGNALDSSTLAISKWVTAAYYHDGYMAEVVFIDGTAYSADSFGEFDEDSGIWKPIDVSGLTFGSDGFYLDFKASGNLGNDANGGTDLTEVNLAAIDQSTDTCTNNFATLNSLYKQASSYTIADGNLTANNTSNTWRGLAGTIGVSSGKWYWEAKAVSGVGASNFISFGIGDAEQIPNGDAEPTASSRIYSYKHNGTKANNNSQPSYGASWTDGDIISILYDADNGSLTFYKNGASQGVAFNGLDTSKTWLPITENYGSSAKMSMNFGSPAYAISSGNTDGDGYGNFEYAVPSGYFSLNTKNLAEYG